MKKFSFILYIFSIIVLAILGAWIGTYIYKINSIGKLETPILEGMENKDLEYELALMASENEEKISPNAILITKTYYKKCGHTLLVSNQIDNKYVNLTKEEFEKIFLKSNLEYTKIEHFTPKEIIVLKETDENCNEHYILKTEKDFLVIYKLNENGREEIYKKTNIGIEYLTDEDLKKLKKGIEIIGESELNSKLEDYV